MKIDSSTFKAPLLRPGSGQQKPADGTSRAQDSVSLANSGLTSLNNVLPVNSGKIQEIKEAITQGRFQINPEAIADSLLATARELINTQNKA